jgi:hypothetical protein
MMALSRLIQRHSSPISSGGQQLRQSCCVHHRFQKAVFPTLNTRFFDHVLLVTWLRVGNSTEWITGWPGWIEAITVFKLGERMTIGQQGRTDGSHGLPANH